MVYIKSKCEIFETSMSKTLQEIVWEENLNSWLKFLAVEWNIVMLYLWYKVRVTLIVESTVKSTTDIGAFEFGRWLNVVIHS